MGMLLDELENIKKEIEGKSWNSLSTEAYKKMKDKLSFYIENYKEDNKVELAKNIVDNIEILCVDDGNFFVNTNNTKNEEIKEQAFTNIVNFLNKI